MIGEKKKMCFPFTKNKYKFHCRGGNGSALGKSFPSFQPLTKAYEEDVWPRIHWGAQVCFSRWGSVRRRAHTFHHTEQHTGLGFPHPPASQGRGWGRPAPPSTRKGEGGYHRGKWPVWGLIESNVKPFVGQASHVLLEFLNIKEKNNLCGTPSPAATTGITYCLLHAISEC